MSFITSILCCIAIMPLFADSIGYVEYQLPKLDQEWKVLNKIDNDKGTTILYVPKDVLKKDSNEFFGVSFTKASSDLEDTDAIKTSLQSMFKDADVDLKILEKGKDWIVMEWSIKVKGEEKAHGWGKAFSNDQGTVLLSFYTGNLKDLDKIKDSWLPAIKAAKEVE